MGASCHLDHHHGHDHGTQNATKLALWIALILNGGMFVVELGAGMMAGSTALLADSADFLGDAANYGIALIVLPLALAWRARAAMLKGVTMGLFGLWVTYETINHILHGTVPEPATMGVVGVAALIVNVAVALMLFRFRSGDSNMRAVWICSRNDALGNLAVLLAASGVFATGTPWPDITVATLMAGLALWGSAQVIASARADLRQVHAPA
jgi:cation diffusion facilitator family transporter